MKLTRTVIILILLLSNLLLISAKKSDKFSVFRRPNYYMYHLGTPNGFLDESELMLHDLVILMSRYENEGTMKSKVGQIKKDEKGAYLNGYSFPSRYYIITYLSSLAGLNLPLRNYDPRSPMHYDVEGIKQLLAFYKEHKVQDLLTVDFYISTKCDGLRELSYTFLTVSPPNSGHAPFLFSSDIVYDNNMLDFLDEISSYYRKRRSGRSFDSLSDFHRNLLYNLGEPQILDEAIKTLLKRINSGIGEQADCTLDISESEKYMLDFLALISGTQLDWTNYCDGLKTLTRFFDSHDYSDKMVYGYWQMYTTLEWAKILDTEEIFVSGDTIKNEQYSQAYQRFLNLLDGVLLKVKLPENF